MAIKPDYEAGTVSITNGTTTLTGVNTFWVLAKIQKGDTFKVKNLDAIIEEVVSNSEITLKEAWTGGDLAAAPYAIRYQPDGSRFAGAYVEIRNLLDSGNVSALAGLTGALDEIPIFTGAGAMTTIPKSELTRGVEFDVQVDTPADRAAYDGQAEGFKVLVSDVGDGRSALYSKASNTLGDWSDPAYITGPVGPVADFSIGTTTTLAPGSAATATITGTDDDPILNLGIPAGHGFDYVPGGYNPATAYLMDDVVRDNGSSWIALQATTGNAPPVFPVTSNAYWELLAVKGLDGTGTGDVVGPASSTDSGIAAFSGTSGKLLKNLTPAQARQVMAVPALSLSLASAQAVVPENEPVIIVRDGMRDGFFFWDSSNLASKVIHNTVTTTAVNASTDVCTLASHGFMTGNAVYTATAVDGLTANTPYYVVRVDANTFKLAATITNAFAGTAVDLTAATNITLKRLSDPLQTVFIIPTALAIDGSQGAYVRDGYILTPQMFGAKADYGQTNTNDHNAIQLWFQTLLCLDDFGYSGVLHGRYYLSQNLILQPTELSSESRGLCIRVATRNHDGFYFANNTRFEMSNPNAAGLFFITFEAYISGNISSSQMVTIGNGDFSDAYNSCDIDLIANNAGTSSIVIVINAAHQSRFKFVANGNASGRPVANGGAGPSSTVGVWLRQVQFCHFSLAAGNSGTGLHMGDGYCLGNTFDGTLDIEEVDIGVLIDTTNIYDNTFLGGIIVATKTFNCNNGMNNKAAGVSIGTGYTGWVLFVGGGERMQVRSRALPALASSGLINPASGTLWRNTTGRQILVRLEGALTGLVVTKADGNAYSQAGLGAGYPVTVVLDAYDGLTLTYSSAPSISYHPIG